MGVKVPIYGKRILGFVDSYSLVLPGLLNVSVSQIFLRKGYPKFPDNIT